MINALDLLIIFFYLALLLGMGGILSKREKLDDFFVAGRKVRTSFLIFTTVSTSVGAGTLIAITAAAYDTGISYALTAAISIFVGYLLVAFLAPRIKKFGDDFKAHTLGDFYGARYSVKNQALVGIIILISYFFWLALQFVAIASLLRVITGWEFEVTLLLSALVTIIYTTLAGIKADIYTDIIQFLIITFVLFFLLMPLSLIKIGGFDAFATLPPKYFNPFSFGGPEFFFGGIIFGIPFMLVSMEIWQRIYASTDPQSAKKVFLLSGLINAPFLIFPAFLGISAALLYPNLDRDLALFNLMKDLLPSGILGLGFVGLLAAVMSTADSLILVGSATILKDFYISIINPQATEKQMLFLGRVFTLLFGLAGLTIAYAIPDIVQLQLIGAFTLLIFAPSVIGGLIWKKTTSKASFLSVMSGFLVTIILIPTLPKTAFIPGFLVSLITLIIVSYLTKHSPTENVRLIK
jgi:Na+/proline symporter